MESTLKSRNLKMEVIKKIPPEVDPFENVPETVCYGYAFHMLGLDPKEAAGGGLEDVVDDYFDRVEAISEANMLGLQSRDRYEHVVYVNPDGRLFHREGSSPPEETTIDKLREKYVDHGIPQAKCDMVFLKLKKTK